MNSIAIALSVFLLISSSLMLASCGHFPRPDVSSFTIEDINNSQYDTIYLKPFNAYNYSPQSDQSVKKQILAVEEFMAVPFHQFRLKNGLQVFILPRNDIPAISISAVVDAGKNHANSVDELISPLVLKLLKQGTEKFSKSEFQFQATRLGEAMNYRLTPQFSLLSVDILPQDLAQAMMLFSQQLAYIKPHSRALEKIIQQQLLENKLAQSSGFYWAKLRFYQNNYPKNHPYFSQQPDSRKIKNISQQQLLGFYQQKYVPENSRLILVGDVDVDEAKAIIVSQFAHWQTADVKTPDIDYDAVFEINNRSSRIDLINRKGAQQANILYGAVTVVGNSPDKTVLDMIATLLGGGPSSRLFADLREQKGLAYSVSAHQVEGRYRSPFFIQTSVAHEKVAQTIIGIKNHIDYLCRNQMDERELEQLKQQMTGEYLFQFQSNKQWRNEKIKQLEMDLDEEYIAQRIRQIQATSGQQILAVMNRHLCNQHQFIVVGEKNKLTENFHR